MTNARRAIREVLRYCEDQGIDGTAGSMGVDVDDQGVAHTRGGYWLSTDERMIYGYTLENARAVQAILAKYAGWPGVHATGRRDKRGRAIPCRCKECRDARASLESYCALDKAEGTIVQAVREPERFAADRSAPRMKTARARAIDAGLCVVCRRVAAREGRVTCEGCNERAKARVRAAREAKRFAAEVDLLDLEEPA